jgi:hypothetical protein
MYWRCSSCHQGNKRRIVITGNHQIPGTGKIDSLVHIIFSGEERRSRLQEESMQNEQCPHGDDFK